LAWQPGPEAVVEYLSEVQRRVSVLVTPVGGSSAGWPVEDARVGFDYAEIRVRYGGEGS